MLLCRETVAQGFQLILSEVDASWPLALNRDKPWLRLCSNNAGQHFAVYRGRISVDETGFAARGDLTR